ncbi:histidine phosphatase superfamily [Gongronella butleri]|nr:histidine phosphatase superfamily [Gongronella butleri]
MAPSQSVEHVFIIRHGERLDQTGEASEWQADPAHGIWDPPLSTTGHEQAEKTGEALGMLLERRKVDLRSATVLIYTSPFQRCIDTTIGLLKGLEPYQSTPAVVRMDLGLGEWMSDHFYDDVYCSGSDFLARHQENLARQQAMHYRSPREHPLPSMMVDYGYQSYTNVFDFPESYTNMVRRFDQTRLRCLEWAAASHLPKKYQTTTTTAPSPTIVLFVTHAIGINALMDSFRNTVTRPIKTNYCCISSFEYKYTSAYDPLATSRATTQLATSCSDNDDDNDDWIDAVAAKNKHWKWVPDLIADDSHLN